MKTKILKYSVITFLSLLLSTGCLPNIFNTKKNFEKLPDKKFYFSEFQFILIGKDKKDAYNFFKKFPVKKVMFLLAKEYNLTIDISNFNNFLNSENYTSIESEGALRVSRNIWKNKKVENNRIVFIFEEDYLDSNNLKFSVQIYNKNSTLDRITTSISKIDTIFDRLKFHLETAKDSLREYEEKNYDKISPIPFVIETSSNSIPIDEQSELNKIKSLIDSYVKSLNQNEKDIFKHDIIDYIYKKCN